MHPTDAVLVLWLGATPPLLLAQAPSDTMPVTVVKRAERAFWAHDVNKLVSLYSPDAEGYAFAAGDTTAAVPEKRDQIQREIEQCFKEHPHHHSKLLSSIVAGSYGARLYADDAGVPQKRKHSYVFEVRGGKIRRYWNGPEAPIS